MNDQNNYNKMKISPSKISCYNTCPLQYSYRYEKKLISIKWKALTLGSRYHELVRQYHIDWNEHQHKIGQEYDLLRSYIKNPVKGNIVDTEKNILFNLELPDGEQVEVNIILDRIDEDKFIDYKTSSVDYKEEDCKTIQSLLYVYWGWVTFGKIYPFVFSVVNKKKVHQKKYVVQTMKPVLYTVEELSEVPTIIQEFLEKVGTGKFPANPSPRCYGCDFWPTGIWYCKHYNKWYKKIICDINYIKLKSLLEY